MYVLLLAGTEKVLTKSGVHPSYLAAPNEIQFSENMDPERNLVCHINVQDLC